MMFRLLFILTMLSPLSLCAYSLKPGDRFPDLAFPLIKGGEEVAVSSLAEKKLMLHLFASW